ncbi:MAG: hypothetical protein LQ343_004460 [Gyalolechia ehrenbergii]|nr:MAG: hypothetical protein LQ343_004460 [Gyalolechia ehrenbergii]
MPLPSRHHYGPSTRSANPSNPQSPNDPNRNALPPPESQLLATLRADELAVHNRKANIRRFGAGWLRPPGVPKTLQGIADERAEREEQELTAGREAAMLEAQAAAEEEEAAAAAAVAAELGVGVDVRGQVVEEEGGGMNLDDEVPDAGDVMGGWESSDDSEEGGDENDTRRRESGIQGEGEISIALDADVGVSFTGEEGEGDYDVPGMLEGGEGRDLDGDVPEAESYQHTDTEAEDESSLEERGSFVVGGGGGGVLGRSVWGGSPVGVSVGGGYDGAGGSVGGRASRTSGGRSSRGRPSRG